MAGAGALGSCSGDGNGGAMLDAGITQELFPEVQHSSHEEKAVTLLVVNSSFSLLSLGCIWGIPLADAIASLSSYPCLPWLVTGNQLLCLLLTWC